MCWTDARSLFSLQIDDDELSREGNVLLKFETLNSLPASKNVCVPEGVRKELLVKKKYSSAILLEELYIFMKSYFNAKKTEHTILVFE